MYVPTDIKLCNDGITWAVDRYVEENPDLNICKNMEHIELMQFTGLKDKNGKEIYEGDIIRYNSGNYEVGFDFGAFYLMRFPKMWDKLHNLMPYDCEVIGNKFENPELLKEAGK